MENEIFALFQLKTKYEGHEDGMELPTQTKLILEASSNYKFLDSLKEELEYSFYKNLRGNFILSSVQKKVVYNFFGIEENWLILDEKLEKITFYQYEKLKELLNISFFKIEEGVPNKEKFYPIFNKQFWDKIGEYDRILRYSDLECFSDNLESLTAEEAYEKAVFLLLLICNLDNFIGDPDVTSAEVDYLSSFENLHRGLLELGKSNIDESLVNKYGLLKFYLIGFNQFFVDKTFFKDFYGKKEEVLGSQKVHFDKLVAYLRNLPLEPIKIINIW